MKKIPLILFHEESFVDNFIKKAQVNFNEKTILLSIDGGYLDDEEGTYLIKVEINISDWSKIKINSFDYQKKFFKKVKVDTFYQLRSIIEFHKSEAEVKLVGFGLNGGWLEWIFTEPKISIYGEIDREEND